LAQGWAGQSGHLRHVMWMGQLIVCAHCRVAYERTMIAGRVREQSVFACYGCGAELESWNGSTVPNYRILSMAPEPLAIIVAEPIGAMMRRMVWTMLRRVGRRRDFGGRDGG